MSQGCPGPGSREGQRPGLHDVSFEHRSCIYSTDAPERVNRGARCEMHNIGVWPDSKPVLRVTEFALIDINDRSGLGADT